MQSSATHLSPPPGMAPGHRRARSGESAGSIPVARPEIKKYRTCFLYCGNSHAVAYDPAHDSAIPGPASAPPMTPYGKVAQAAIAAMSLLAEHYAPDGGQRLNSREIAARRRLSAAIVGKVLTTLSQHGLVSGSPGPGGGYALARAPREITLHAVVSPFDRLDDTLVCPFGEGWCGSGPHCPLHEQLSTLRSEITSFLQQTTLARFQPQATAAKRRK